MRDDKEYLHDIIDAITQIEKYAFKGFAEFKSNELIQVWIIHHLEIIGEASRKISEEIQTKYPNIPWARIIAMRNILIHDYFGIDLEEVWTTVERHLPELKTSIGIIIEELI